MAEQLQMTFEWFRYSYGRNHIQTEADRPIKRSFTNRDSYDNTNRFF